MVLGVETLERSETVDLVEQVPTVNREQAWLTVLSAVAGALNTNNRLDRRQQSWLNYQRRAARSGTLSDARSDKLDQSIPGWRKPTKVRSDRWQGSAEDLANFTDLAGRLPSANRDKPDEAELYRWMMHQRRNARQGRLPRARIKWLDRNVPNWYPLEDSRLHAWLQRLEEVVQFREKYGRLPSMNVWDEARIGRWLSTQRYMLRLGRLDPDRVQNLTERLPEWCGS